MSFPRRGAGRPLSCPIAGSAVLSQKDGRFFSHACAGEGITPSADAPAGSLAVSSLRDTEDRSRRGIDARSNPSPRVSGGGRGPLAGRPRPFRCKRGEGDRRHDSIPRIALRSGREDRKIRFSPETRLPTKLGSGSSGRPLIEPRRNFRERRESAAPASAGR